MTDETNIGEVTQSVSSEHQKVDQMVNPDDQVAEKMLPQSKVNEIVGATKKSAYDKAYQDARAELESNKGTSETKAAQSSGNVEEIVSGKITEYFNDMYSAQQAEIAKAEAQKTLTSLQGKVDEASKKYEDFEDVTKDIPYGSFPDLLTAADGVDNSGDVLYHLGKNPSKFRELASALSNDNPLRSVALKELSQLSASLKNNESARNKDLPRSPLSSIRPSNVGADNGKAKMSDLRKKWTV